MAMNYVPLRCHSNFSFLYGAVNQDRLLDAALKYNYHSVGLTDTNGLYGQVEFYNRAEERGMKSIPGCEIQTEIGLCVFLAKSMAGFGSLSRISTIKMLEEREPGLEDIERLSGGLILIYLDTRYTRRLKDIFKDDLYLGLESFTDLQTRLDTRERYRLARELDINIVAADPVYFLDNNDIKTHRALSAVKNLVTIDQLTPHMLENEQAFLYPLQQMKKRFRDYPEALSNTLKIAEKCDLKLPVGKLNFPEFQGCARVSNFNFLRGKAEIGLNERYPKLTGEIYSQFESELAVIKQTGFVDYFLIVSEIVEFCKRECIPVVGRGSTCKSSPPDCGHNAHKQIPIPHPACASIDQDRYQADRNAPHLESGRNINPAQSGQPR